MQIKTWPLPITTTANVVESQGQVFKNMRICVPENSSAYCFSLF